MAYQGAPVVTLEEHYWDANLNEYIAGPAAARPPQVMRRLEDIFELRIREMDEAGVDMQILSLTTSTLQDSPGREAVDLARGANERLAELIQRAPTRFGGFAVLPTADPDAAVLELERSTRELKMHGAMISGLTQGAFLDDTRFRPLLGKAEELGVPIYIHPGWPLESVVRDYFGEYADRFPRTVRGAWGFTFETATQAFRLILSGAFEEFPKLSIILGHMGEGLPFLLWRINNTYENEKEAGPAFREVLRRNFHITTSGFFSTPALKCVIDEMDLSRVMFSVDYPYASIAQGMRWLTGAGLDDVSLKKVLGGNAIELLGIKLA